MRLRQSIRSMRWVTQALLVPMLLAACAGTGTHRGTVLWPLREIGQVAGQPTEIAGAPEAMPSGANAGVCFDGVDDGLFMAVNPLAGWDAFTIEVRIKPDVLGPEEQRFVHLEDDARRRVLLETRLDSAGWSLDTFLFQDADHKRTLLDRSKRHPAGRWYWVALVYDGRTMSHYVNGILELEGEVPFGPMTAGRTSVGVRQNRVSWFKGCIDQARFTPAALPAASLQRR